MNRELKRLLGVLSVGPRRSKVTHSYGRGADSIEDITEDDKRILAALKAAIADPSTPADKRAELDEELGSIADGYANIDVLTDDERAEYLASRGKLASQ